MKLSEHIKFGLEEIKKFENDHSYHSDEINALIGGMGDLKALIAVGKGLLSDAMIILGTKPPQGLRLYYNVPMYSKNEIGFKQSMAGIARNLEGFGL